MTLAPPAVLLTGKTLRSDSGITRGEEGEVPQGRHRLTGHGQQKYSRATAHRGEEATTVEARGDRWLGGHDHLGVRDHRLGRPGVTPRHDVPGERQLRPDVDDQAADSDPRHIEMGHGEVERHGAVPVGDVGDPGSQLEERTAHQRHEADPLQGMGDAADGWIREEIGIDDPQLRQQRGVWR